jgi:hypothetical protein
MQERLYLRTSTTRTALPVSPRTICWMRRLRHGRRLGCGRVKHVGSAEPEYGERGLARGQQPGHGQEGRPACAEPAVGLDVASVWSLHCYPVLLRNHPSLISSETFNAFPPARVLSPKDNLGWSGRRCLHVEWMNLICETAGRFLGTPPHPKQRRGYG